jgi:hypothetical protein
MQPQNDDYYKDTNRETNTIWHGCSKNHHTKINKLNLIETADNNTIVHNLNVNATINNFNIITMLT